MAFAKPMNVCSGDGPPSVDSLDNTRRSEAVIPEKPAKPWLSSLRWTNRRYVFRWGTTPASTCVHLHRNSDELAALALYQCPRPISTCNPLPQEAPALRLLKL